jgi:hypothetical protein
MSKIEVNAIEPQCGTNLTVGASGDTITFPSGTTVVNNGSQTGFGRTGTVDWDTTAKTASFTAVSGNGYFVNTTSGAITLTLPASPSAGDIVAFKDYAFTFATNNLTVDGNGSPIGGVDGTQGPIYSTNGTSKTFIYVDGTKGWLVTNESTDTSEESSPTYIVATGGTITCCGDYKIHTFTGPGTFTVCSVGNPFGSNTVDYLVAAGGGGGASQHSGGGGAGGLRFSSSTFTAPCTSAPRAGSALPVSATGYPITIGGGGAARPGTGSPSGACSQGNSGSNSSFSTITSTAGGGGGGYGGAPRWNGLPGGSGGGGGSGSPGGPGGTGNTPPVSPSQGNDGGDGAGAAEFSGGGGGGAGAAGANDSPTVAGTGGVGLQVNINGTGHYWSGGGGGGSEINVTGGNGGLGGGGGGGSMPAGTQGTGGGSALNPGADAVSGDGGAGGTNTGGGGGASGSNAKTGAAGGSGIVIIRYKYQ